jgi:DNA polymerase
MLPAGFQSALTAVVDEMKAMRLLQQTHAYVEAQTLESLESIFKDYSLPLEPETEQQTVIEIHQPPIVESIKPSAAPTFSVQLQSPDLMNTAPFTLPEGDKQTRWDWLRNHVLNCPVCKTHVKPEKQVVFGVGNLDADIFFCGEAPGADEEIEGEPFVGKAGQLLTKIIQAMGLKRSDVYIGNIMNWRPEMPTAVGNRPPTPDEMAVCLPYLKAQVEIVRPKVIVALGNTAVTGLLGQDSKRRLTDIRGTWMEFEGITLLPTYHPSYLLRYASPEIKRLVWEDMMNVMERVGLPISEKQRGFFK